MNNIYNNDYGKYLNLIFNIGKAQQTESSGGSWGYGKTVYYRIGIGLVIFYSRIFENGVYKSRLVISFVQNENDTIIPSFPYNKNVKSGIMWFGRNVEKELYPIEDENDIADILNLFSLPKYDGTETGTTIIIPYINTEELLDDTCEDKENKPAWCNSIESYIKVAVQRWYAPRLMNNEYRDNPYLVFFVNDKLFDIDNDFLPLFKVINELYKISIDKNFIDNKLFYRKEISLQRKFIDGNIAGVLAFTKVDRKYLKMEIPENMPSPYMQITNNFNNSTSNDPIITFCRKPGMLLKYDIKESWSNSIGSDESGEEFIIGLFVANSNNRLKDLPVNLEEYLRSTEKADHTTWIDCNNYDIVKKIQGHVQNKIKSNFEMKIIEDIKVVDSKIARNLTNLFLPKTGFGKRASLTTQNENKGTAVSKKTSKSSLDFIESSLRRSLKNNNISKDFIIKFFSKDKNIEYKYEIATEDTNISIDKWKETVRNKEVPIKIEKISFLYKKNNEDIEYLINAQLNSFVNIYKDEELKITKKFTNDNEDWIGWNIEILSKCQIKELRCRITYNYTDSNYMCVLSKVKED